MSKQVSNNPRKFLPALRTTSKDYISLMTLAVRLVSFMTAAIAIYATPNPTLANVTLQVTALRTAIGAGGSKNNRGSRASIELIRTEAETLRSMIIAVIAYAVNTTTVNTSQQTQALYNYLLSGLSTKKIRRVTGADLDIIRKFKISTSGSNLSSLTFTWEKPKGMVKGQPAHLYKLEYKNQLINFWAPFGETTKTKFQWNDIPINLRLSDIQLRIIPMSKNGFGQPYEFRVMNSANVAPPPPFIVTDSLASLAIQEINAGDSPYPYTNITLSAEDSPMTFYFSTASAVEPVFGEPVLVIPAGTSQTMTVQALFELLEFSLARPFFNVKNTGLVEGIWTVTFFV